MKKAILITGVLALLCYVGYRLYRKSLIERVTRLNGLDEGAVDKLSTSKLLELLKPTQPPAPGTA